MIAGSVVTALTVMSAAVFPLAADHMADA